MDNHEITELKISHCGTVVHANYDDIISWFAGERHNVACRLSTCSHWIATLVDPGISFKVKDGYLHKYKRPKIMPLLKLNRNDHPLKVDNLPEALCYLSDG